MVMLINRILGISKRAENQIPFNGRRDAFREITPWIVTARQSARTLVLSNQFTNPLDYQEFYLLLE